MLAPLGATVLVAALGAVLAAAQEPGATGTRLAFRLTDPRITESSGLASSARHQGVVWTVNDSGGGARLYAVGTRDGRTRARISLPGLDPYDWEALAPGPGQTLWVGDIGDNSRRRDTVAVFRLREPTRLVDAGVAWTRIRLAYPDGPHDAEALLVHPRTGRVYVATKGILGARLYAAPQRLRADTVNPLVPVADVPALVTDGAFTPDGRSLVLRGYDQAWVYDATTLQQMILRQTGVVDLPATEQGESLAVTADGHRLLVGSEGAASPVWEVPLPPAARAVPRPGAGAADAPAASTAATPAAPSPRPARETRERVWAPALTAVVGAVLVAAALVVARRPRRGGRRGGRGAPGAPDP